MKTVQHLETGGRIDRMMITASVRYNCRFNPDLFNRACRGKTSARTNRLIDEAMALCGSPYYKVTHTNWAEAELAFLAQFADDGEEGER
jgi:hypothetical protein